jgi:hypothetical protein
MKTPLPPIYETPAEVQEFLTDERDAQKHQRLQVLSLLQTQQARTRRQVARLLGVNHDTCRVLAGRVCERRPRPDAHDCPSPRPSSSLVPSHSTRPA